MDLSSTDTFPQIFIAIVVSLAVFVSYLVLETLYRAYLSYGGARVAVYPVTGSGKKKVFKQDPNNPNNTLLPFSENQLTGIEFSYSTFLYVSEDSIDSPTEEGWYSVFYKGYETQPFPLCGPGVFVGKKGTNNNLPTLRVVMNTYDKWFNPIDVEQIPINKWFHLVVCVRKNSCEIYVNGNLANKKSFAGTLPYQNYQPLVLFSDYKNNGSPNDWKTSAAGSEKKGLPVGENFIIKGKFNGYISNLYYFSYALTYSEIQGMLGLGPSSQFDDQSMDKPPYLIDSWWTSR
jgi:hypothetical protein